MNKLQQNFGLLSPAWLRAMCFSLLTILSFGLKAQTITTTFANNNGSAVVVFSITNSSATASYLINDIGSVAGFTGTGTARLYAKAATYNVAPGAAGVISAANGWTDIGANTSLVTTSNTTTNVATTWISGMSYIIPPLTQVRFCLQHISSAGATSFSASGGNLQYSTVGTQTCTFASGDLTLNSCANYGFGGTLASPTNTPRGFVGFVNYGSAAPCSGTPAPGNTISSAASACPSNPFTLSVQNNTSGSGVTRLWESADDAAFTVNVQTLASTGPSATATQTTAKWYRCTVTCGVDAGVSTPVQVLMNSFNTCYCTSTATSTADEDISNVTVGSMNNSSTCSTTAPGAGSVSSMYSNYTGVTPANVMQLENVNFSVTQTTCGGNYGNRTYIFIDYNQNGLYTDPGENVFAGPVATGTNTQSGTFQIPVTATVGTTGMRVITSETTAAIAPCGTYSWGETEDYLITINATSACAGTPAPGNTLSSGGASVCSGIPFNLSLQNFTTGTGVTYQWESADDAAFTVGVTALGTNSLQTASQTSAKWYRCTVVCGGNAGISTPLNVTMNSYVSCYCVPI